MHDNGTFQFLDGEWQRNTVAKDSEINSPEDLDDHEFFSYEDRMAVMMAPEGSEIYAFGDDEGASFDEIGCFAACHSSMRNMSKLPDAAEVAAARADGRFLDLWQYRAPRSATMYGASNDYIMEYRHSGQGGVNYWFSQDPADQAEDAHELFYDSVDHVWRDGNSEVVNLGDYAWMYDVSKTGFHALPTGAVDPDEREVAAAWSQAYPLITQGPERNALPLDPNLISQGDMLPRRVLRYGTEVRGATNAFSIWQPLTNTYTVIFRSPIDGSESDLDLSGLHQGQAVTAGFGVFDAHSSNRFHHVSFPVSIGTDSEADIVARDNR